DGIRDKLVTGVQTCALPICQSFIAAMIDKIRETRDLVSGRNIDIEVDGGITAETAPLVVKAGANALVTGSAVFKGDAKAYARNRSEERRVGKECREWVSAGQ